jgi:hypothetical protein
LFAKRFKAKILRLEIFLILETLDTSHLLESDTRINTTCNTAKGGGGENGIKHYNCVRESSELRIQIRKPFKPVYAITSNTEISYGFLFRSEFIFRTTQELEFFFCRAEREFFSQYLTLGYMTKILNLFALLLMMELLTITL